MDRLTDTRQISRLEVVDSGRRRRWSDAAKLRIIEESLSGPRLVSATARRNGISNQLLATVALCVGTTVIIKMGKAKFAFVTIIPMVWLTIVTSTAGLTKIFSADPKLGFLSHARLVESQILSGKLPAAIKSVDAAHRIIFNDRLDTAVAGFFLCSVVLILAASFLEWYKVLSGKKAAVSSESKYVASQLMGEAA